MNVNTSISTYEISRNKKFLNVNESMNILKKYISRIFLLSCICQCQERCNVKMGSRGSAPLTNIECLMFNVTTL